MANHNMGEQNTAQEDFKSPNLDGPGVAQGIKKPCHVPQHHNC